MHSVAPHPAPSASGCPLQQATTVATTVANALASPSAAVRLGASESYTLLAALLHGVTSEARRYAHRWEEGDFIVWDNRITLHSATDPALVDGPRLMHRVRLDGKGGQLPRAEAEGKCRL